ncbi:MAG: two-component system response regulator [Blastocatellia bacterium AA13]|nr:MAG: two-component system response regulator [Blastocatellia bacterium AA13]
MANLIAAPLTSSGLRTAKILIIDDETNVLSVLDSLLSEQYECKTATSAAEALEYLKEESYDLVLSDIMMPGMSGLELLEEISRQARDTVVVLISGNLNIQSAIEAMRRGAFDYVTKPFNISEVETAVQRALRHRLLIKANRQYEQHLEELVSLRTNELSMANVNLNLTLERLYINYRATLQSLAAALEARDVETRGHSDRVVAYCMRIGKYLGLTGREMIALEHGALLHDIGKIGVPDAILLKRGSLTDEEWAHMRRHVEFGSQILCGIDFLEGASQIVSQHHERFNGGGYPRGLGGDQICLGARIFAVADAVDAITSDRPYRKARPFEAAAEELLKCAGAHFDPDIVDTFTQIPMDSWREIRQLATEPGLVVQEAATGKALEFSFLKVDADRIARKWA